MLTHDEIEKIKEQESIRLQLRRELNPEKKRSKFWEFLNSQFFLWLLGSVVLSGITYYWNHRDDARVAQAASNEKAIAAQREDSQFLVTLLSYLTNPDLRVRLRAIDVIKVRYPDDKVPSAIQQLIAEAAIEGASIPNSRQTEETKHLVNKAVRFLDKLNHPDPSIVQSLQQLPTRVYLQISDQIPREKIVQIQTDLQQANFLVAGVTIEKSDLDTGAPSEVVYADPSSKASADRLLSILLRNGLPGTDSLRSDTKTNLGIFEVRIAPPRLGTPTIQFAPKGLEDGSITGTNFGDHGIDVYVQPRIKRAALDRYPEDKCLHGDSSLSVSNSHQVKDISLSSRGVVQKWQMREIQLKFPDSVKREIVNEARRNSHGCVVDESDLEYGFTVERTSDEESLPFFP